MPSHAEFIANIAQHPADMGPRLVYADWLEERGDVRAEYIRLAIELDGMPPEPRTFQVSRAFFSVKRDKFRACMVWPTENPIKIGERVNITFDEEEKGERNRYDNLLIVSHERPVIFGPEHKSEALAWLKMDENSVPWPSYPITKRCAALLAEHRKVWTMAGLPEEWKTAENYKHFEIYTDGGFPKCDNNYAKHIRIDFARGFPEVLTLRWEELERHYQTLIDAMPVREVRLTTEPTYDVMYRLRERTGLDWRPGDEPDRWERVIAAEFPGHDREQPIRYTLPATATSAGTASPPPPTNHPCPRANKCSL